MGIQKLKRISVMLIATGSVTLGVAAYLGYTSVKEY